VDDDRYEPGTRPGEPRDTSAPDPVTGTLPGGRPASPEAFVVGAAHVSPEDAHPGGLDAGGLEPGGLDAGDLGTGDFGEPDGEAADHHRHRAGRLLREWIVVVAIALLLALLVRTFLLQQFSIPSESMSDTLERGDRVFVNKLSYRLHDVNRGDVVVFARPPGQPDDGIKDLIKRVIGLPGETLEFRDCQVVVDGLVLEEPYVDRACTTPPAESVDPEQDAKVTVPDGMVFVMGDNREGSFDSRYFGPIDQDSIVGRAFVIVWPISRWAWL
jgi:signal peptidase I